MENTTKYRKNLNLNSETVRNKIFQYLHSADVNNILSYELIKNFQEVESIKQGEYIICPRFIGTRSWIIFYYDEQTNVYYAVSFPKHNIKKRDDVSIYPIEIPAGKNFYNGTIMEGIFYKVNEIKYLVIDEVYLLYGESQILKSKIDRLNIISNRLRDVSNIKNKMNMYVSKYYTIDKSSLSELYSLIKTDDRIQELTFYPRNINGKIYSYAISKDDLVDHVVTIGVYVMQKTSKTEVYNIILPGTKDKIGIAYIPDIEVSKICKRWFLDNKKKELMVKFQKDSLTKKWVPVELVSTTIG